MGKIYEALERLESDQLDSKRMSAGKTRSTTFRMEETPELVVVNMPGSILAEQFRFLRSRIIRPEDKQMRRSILITSALQGEGKSFIASNLAVVLALGVDEHVLLIDADLRSPKLHKVFGYSSEAPGLSDHLIDEVPLSEVLHKTEIDKLTILPAGKYVGNPTELLSSSRMQDLLVEVRDKYKDRFVIIDSAPLEVAPETVIMSHEVDGSYLVIRYCSTPRTVVKRSKERFLKDKFLGVIFNGFQDKEYKYRYGSDYYNYNYKRSKTN
jgi:exopolysaccharide/PEP-CTERM locus tyrosine autokinase